MVISTHHLRVLIYDHPPRLSTPFLAHKTGVLSVNCFLTLFH